MGISFKVLHKCLPHVIKIRKPILLRSAHGQGKSSVVYQLAEELGMKVIERRASQMIEGEISGLPKLQENSHDTTWYPPDWFMQACREPVLLFMDELDRATTEVRQGFFELSDSRKIAGHYLHEDTLIFAAVNSGEHASKYQVGEFDPAELDRWVTFDLSPTKEDWINWGKKGNIIPVVLDYISKNSSFLEHTGNFEPNKVYPSRRSWHRFSDCLKESGLRVDKNNWTSTIFNICNAFVGLEAAVSFSDFVKNYDSIVLPKDIIDDGKLELIKDLDLNSHISLMEKIKLDSWLDKKLTKKQITNLANYFNILPSELAMKLFSDVGGGNTDNIVTFHSLVEKKLISYIKTIDIENKDK